MAQLILTIPDAVVPRVNEALAEGISPSATKSKTVIIDYVKSVVYAYEARKAHEAEAELLRLAEATVISDITIT